MNASACKIFNNDIVVSYPTATNLAANSCGSDKYTVFCDMNKFKRELAWEKARRREPVTGHVVDFAFDHRITNLTDVFELFELLFQTLFDAQSSNSSIVCRL